MTVQEFVNIDKDLQTVQGISDVNIIILIYLFIKHVLFILMYLYMCKMHHCMSVELKVYLFIWSHNFRFSMSLSLSPNSLYRQTTDCTEDGGLTRVHCILYLLRKIIRSYKYIQIVTLYLKHACMQLRYVCIKTQWWVHPCAHSIASFWWNVSI
jgi:hypothetical protein